MIRTFSSETKAELVREVPIPRHCQIAELAAILSLCGNVVIDVRGRISLKIRTENVFVARKCFTLLKKTFTIKAETAVRRNHETEYTSYCVGVSSDADARRVLEATKILDGSGEILSEEDIVRNVVVKQACCRRAFLRGAFLAAGSISDPKKSYHFEIVCPSRQKAEQIIRLMNTFGTEAKYTVRKKAYVVYLKEGNQIVDILNVMGAHCALMDMENVRILKGMRNDVNRKVNCEAANIHKTVSAAVKQGEDIAYIKETRGLEFLPDTLREAAEARLMRPAASLKELGEKMNPPVGKSGMNHRLRKIGKIADDLREGKI